MSHVAAAGSVRITTNRVGKRLGVKRYAGQVVANGNIIVKQRGTVYHPGKNVKLSNDYSIYAIAAGVVSFRKMSGRKRGQFYIDVLPAAEVTATETVKVVKTAKPVAKVAKATK